MEEKIKELKEEIIEQFNNKNNTYEYNDRLQVALHEIVDSWVSIISFEEVLEYLKEFSQSDFETLDKGLYENVLEKRGFEVLCRVLLYCLVEQELYNDKEFNKLQFVEEVAGIKLK
ncbi:MAG: hypothetical protein ACE5KE_00525 [Methanosarcinales archaeon]